MWRNLLIACILLLASVISAKDFKYASQTQGKELSVNVKKGDGLRKSLLLKHYPIMSKEQKLMQNDFEKRNSIVDSSMHSLPRFGDDNRADNVVERRGIEQHKDDYGEGGFQMIKNNNRKIEKKYPLNGIYKEGNVGLSSPNKPLTFSQNEDENPLQTKNIFQLFGQVMESLRNTHFNIRNNSSVRNPSNSFNQAMSKEDSISRPETGRESHSNSDDVISKPQNNDFHKGGGGSSSRIKANFDNNTVLVKNSEPSPLKANEATIKSVIRQVQGVRDGQAEGDWKFHFKQKDALDLSEENKEDKIFHLEKRDAPAEGAGAQTDWKSHVGDASSKMPALPLNGTDER
ncbi:hypothetical protein ElyMa_004011200 [Elysia marginata]|uniref:Uncharacterized protein n=1 Tax=Elysia marginata TaxID=1093978 RepID=A0AAV4G1T0_9GAST|nr:hypothetical protein ElyMa_004011200 [Elysia marginata]